MCCLFYLLKIRKAWIEYIVVMITIETKTEMEKMTDEIFDLNCMEIYQKQLGILEWLIEDLCLCLCPQEVAKF